MADTAAASAASAASVASLFPHPHPHPHPKPRASSPPSASTSTNPRPRPHLPSKSSSESTTRAAANTSTPLIKRKQSKSRNGCLTCKAKRLKCDETKPACQQCARRSVPCGGYKKDFKWRPFEEASFAPKPPPKTARKPPVDQPFQHQSHHLSHSRSLSIPATVNPPPPNDSSLAPGLPHHAFVNPLQPVYYPQSQPPPPLVNGFPTISPVTEPYPPAHVAFQMPQPPSFVYAPPPISPVDSFAAASLDNSSIFESESVHTRLTKTTAPSSVSSGQSPRLVDLLLPGTDLSVPPEEYTLFRSQHEAIYQPTGLTPPADVMEEDEDDVEEVPRIFPSNHDSWVMRPPSPSPSSSSSSSSDSQDFRLLSQPQMALTSPEMLTRRFDRDTCGILSVKDGPTENPWRTLVWPLARDCPALYHAIASLTSFHQSKDSPAMRIQGIDHMRAAVHALASSLENMRVEAAISTTLVLAFSESWDQHISTGINHIKGAKILLNRALVQRNQTPMLGEDFGRLKFLCNTWIYMDVIARLTSAESDESNDFDLVYDSIHTNGETDTKLDPLMGCATTLFPIIGRVANLVRKVRRTNGNGPAIISQAVQLKSQLEDWTPPSFIEDPEDQSTSPHDSIKTAAAYQYATLLYLHQAVPEIPSLPSAVLAKRVLCELATVNIRSRSTIVHIYPLMAAGCEVMEQEDRDWVCERWGLMSSRMKLGIIEKCLEVTKEVWSRRDAHMDSLLLENDQNSGLYSPSTLKRNFSSFSFEDFETVEDPCWNDPVSKRRAVNGTSFSDHIPIPVQAERVEGNGKTELGTEFLRHEFTVKGRLHWLGVMKDWNWEVLLG